MLKLLSARSLCSRMTAFNCHVHMHSVSRIRFIAFTCAALRMAATQNGERFPLLNRLRGLDERRELPAGLRGRAPAENECQCFLTSKEGLS